MSKQRAKILNIPCGSVTCKKSDICDPRDPPRCVKPQDLDIKRLAKLAKIEYPESWEDVTRIYNIEEFPEGTPEDEIRRRALSEIKNYHPKLKNLPESPIDVNRLLKGRQILTRLVREKQSGIKHPWKTGESMMFGSIESNFPWKIPETWGDVDLEGITIGGENERKENRPVDISVQRTSRNLSTPSLETPIFYPQVRRKAK